MILETTPADYTRLILGQAPRQLQLADTAIAPLEVIEMLAGVAAQVWAIFPTASWLVVENNELVGLCSITRAPKDGVVDIGYGIAPSRRGHGYAAHAVGDVVAWANGRAEVIALTADTSTTNPASQRVLELNGFVRTGERIDEEDGPLNCWRRQTE